MMTASSKNLIQQKEIPCLDLVDALFPRFPNPSRNEQVLSLERLPKNIPFEIVIEILSWLPVESLLRFKCVGKQWFSLIDGQDDKFIAKQRERGSHSLLSYYQNRQDLEYLQAISDENFEFVVSQDGLCLDSRIGYCHVVRIRNPATRRVVYLPDAHKDTCNLSIALDSSTGECKVVSTYSIKKEHDDEDFGTGGVGFQVLTIGEDEQWRPLKHPHHDLSLHHFHDEEVIRHCSIVCPTHSVVHACEVIMHDGQPHVELYHLDMFRESFTTTTLTEEVFPDLLDVIYFIWDGRLAIAKITGDMLSILVLEDYKQPKWSENKIIIPLKLTNHADLLLNKIYYLDIDSLSNQILFKSTCGDQYVRYDMKTEYSCVVEWSQMQKEFLASIKSSLVSIKGMKPE